MLEITTRPSWAGPNPSPSTELADRFVGVEIPNDATPEQQRKAVNAFIETLSLIEHLGWYDHTSDWDFHIGVELMDGRANTHIGDGAEIAWLGEAPTMVHATED